MKETINIPILYSLVILLSGCQSFATTNTPEWITKPGKGVAVSAPQGLYGYEAQERHALSKAYSEVYKHYAFLNPAPNQNLTTHKIAPKQRIKIEIKARWLDRETNTLWLWAFPKKP